MCVARPFGYICRSLCTRKGKIGYILLQLFLILVYFHHQAGIVDDRVDVSVIDCSGCKHDCQGVIFPLHHLGEHLSFLVNHKAEALPSASSLEPFLDARCNFIGCVHSSFCNIFKGFFIALII